MRSNHRWSALVLALLVGLTGVHAAEESGNPALDELRRTIGESEWETWVAAPDHRRFLAELKNPDGWLDELMHSGPLPDDPAKMLSLAAALWKSDASGLRDRYELTTAAAVALTFGQKSWPGEEEAMSRYVYFRDSRRQGLLHPMFDQLETWEKRFVVSAGNNGRWGDKGGWGDDSLVWLRDHVKLPVSAYVGACWQAPYRLHNVFGDSIHGRNYYAPFSDMIHAERVRDVGGVCGSLSHYGATAARANGIPAITMGEPGHCAYAVRVARGEWTPAYSLSWKRGLHTSLWGRTWTQLLLQEKVMTDSEATRRSTEELWEARSHLGGDPKKVADAYRRAIAAQPLAHPTWLEFAKWQLDVAKPSLIEWKQFHDEVLVAFADYPEAAWDVLKVFMPSILPQVPAEERMPFLVAFHDAIADHPGPVMWNIEAALNEQATMLGGDTATQLEFFEQVVAMQLRSERWLAPLVAWGRNRFVKEGEDANAFFNALTAGLASGGEGSESLGKVLRPVILAAAESGNADAFQGLSQLRSSAETEAPDYEPFDGELLSAGGILTVSTTSRWDRPEEHAALLGPGIGFFHTNAEVRPHAIVQLSKLGELSGLVVIENSWGHNANRIMPFKVSVSEDGETWTEVGRLEKHEKVWRLPLDERAARVAYVKIERDDDRKEVFHLHGIHVFGRRLQ
ncbi:hypothetical protein [Haloferula rosea]|uniref:F5/8 type C domain-containing protein n=1 Tax=Haloferula rosea TaxID=490093 RepID=A0A934VE25_9BACT|nr:hypothetical protein [Haloferula rosea]MBK1825616.1 hypothetical protein [Haloferula rosea]